MACVIAAKTLSVSSSAAADTVLRAQAETAPWEFSTGSMRDDKSLTSSPQ